MELRVARKFRVGPKIGDYYYIIIIIIIMINIFIHLLNYNNNNYYYCKDPDHLARFTQARMSTPVKK